MSAIAQIIELLEIQHDTALATEISNQLAAAEALALQKTKLEPDDRASGTTLRLVSRGGIATATFSSLGSVLAVRGTCNKDGAFVCLSKQAPPRVPGPFQFIVEGHCIKVYRLKELVWQCGE